jgi:hypothetical protein
MKNRKVKIEFPLPFFIPIEEGYEVVRDYEHLAAFKFEFKPYTNKSLKSNPEVEESCTKIVIEFIPNDPEVAELESQKIIRPAILHSMILLNNFLDCFRLMNRLNFIRNFNITDLPPIIDVKVDGELFKYITNPTTIVQRSKSLNIERVNLVQSRLQYWDSHNYFQVIDKFRSKAVHHLYTEDFLFAIIELQTSFEAYIRLCHNLILLKEGASSHRIEALKSIPLKNTIINHLGKSLKENLDFEVNPVFREWNLKLYSLRNNIVHSGFSYVSGDEAYDAYDAFQAAVNYLTDLMVREKFIEEGGWIRVEDLVKNTSKHVDFDKVVERLKERGLYDPSME